MNTEITDKDAKEPVGWIFYDAECAFCVRAMKGCEHLFTQCGFKWLPIQTPGTAQRLGVHESTLAEEMKVLLTGGRVVGGFDAWAVLLRSVWWLWPVGWFFTLPGDRWMGKKFYRWLAKNRYCLDGRCELREEHRLPHRPHTSFFEMP